jgi:hypothetical protein
MVARARKPECSPLDAAVICLGNCTGNIKECFYPQYVGMVEPNVVTPFLPQQETIRPPGPPILATGGSGSQSFKARLRKELDMDDDRGLPFSPENLFHDPLAEADDQDQVLRFPTPTKRKRAQPPDPSSRRPAHTRKSREDRLFQVSRDLQLLWELNGPKTRS